MLSADASLSAADAQTLALEPGFATGGHALTISDNVANLLALPGGLQFQAATLALAANQSVSASQLNALLALGGKFDEAQHVLTVTGNAAELAGLSGPALALVVASMLTQSAVVSATTAATLAALPGFLEADGATLTVQDDAAHLLALSRAVLRVTGLEELPAGGVTLTAAQAAGLVALGHFSAAGTTITVADTVNAFEPPGQ